MSKRTQQRKLERAALEQARRITVGKMVRLLLKSLLFAMLVASLMVALSLLGIPWLTSTWVQLAVMILVYLLAYPYLIREFRPEMYLKRQKRE